MAIKKITDASTEELLAEVEKRKNATPSLNPEKNPWGPVDNGMCGQYVVVRCRDAGVHAGILKAHSGRECLLHQARRLWYWKPAKGKYLSGIAQHGLHADSKIGEPIDVHLTENCEIILCTEQAVKSISGMESK